MRPLFLMSLPRAGSTMVQRVLAAHPEISTVSEPWLLLPHVYATRGSGLRAEYWQESAAEGLSDFLDELEGGRARYWAAVGEFARSLYGAAVASETEYFLDKTPHYHAIAEELPELFPDAKFVVLWRNPLAVLTSLLATFRDSRFEPYLFTFDLFDGIDNLTRFAAEREDSVHSVRYEDLVGIDRERHWRGVLAHLGLEFDPALLREFSQVELRGRYGDPTGRESSTISTETLDKWKAALAGPVRKVWCQRWLRWIGEDRMHQMGYDHDQLCAELDALPSRHAAAKDLAQLGASRVSAKLRKIALAWPDSPRPRGGIYRLGKASR